GAFVGVEILLMLKAGGILDPLNPFLVLLLIVLTGMAVSGLLAVAIERVAYRPLRGAPRLIPLISAIGGSFVLPGAVPLFPRLRRNAFYLTYPSFAVFNRRIELGETVDFSVKSILVVLASLLMLGLLQFLVNRTKLGKAIRAVAEDQPTASLM